MSDLMSFDNAGYWLFSDCGMVFPFLPFKAITSNIPTIMKNAGVEKFMFIDASENMPAWFCDAEPAGKNHFMLSLFEKNCTGPILFVGPRVEQKETPIARADLPKLLHPCLWPLTASERDGKPLSIKEDLGALAHLFISNEVWSQLWTDNLWFVAPCKTNDVTLDIFQTVVQDGIYSDGAFARRELIPNPSLPFNHSNATVDTVALSVIHVFRGKQRQRAIVHFSSTGHVLRCQINCFNYGCEEDSGRWVQEYANTITNKFQFEQLKQ